MGKCATLRYATYACWWISLKLDTRLRHNLRRGVASCFSPGAQDRFCRIDGNCGLYASGKESRGYPGKRLLKQQARLLANVMAMAAEGEKRESREASVLIMCSFRSPFSNGRVPI